MKNAYEVCAHVCRVLAAYGVLSLAFASQGFLGDRCAAAYSLPATGQTTCSNDTEEIACPQPGEEYFGQDGSYRAGVPMAYTTPGNGTVTDQVTGLLWDRNPYTVQQNYTDAAAYCDALSLGGHDDWRVPSQRELVTILNIGVSPPTWSAAFSGPYANAGYFSSNASAGDATKQVGVDFRYGNILIESASKLGYVRCVHGDALAEAYVANGDGTVSDTSTGLVWEQAGSTSGLSWKDALAYCENRETGGYTDWRLPNYKELLSIVDYTRWEPAIDAIFSAVSNSYWTSSTRYGYPNNGIYINFASGYASYYYSKSYAGYARCVRGGTTNAVVAVLTGVPTAPTPKRSAAITVGGTGVTAYKYSLDGGAWSAETSITTPVSLAGLSLGAHTLSVVGKNSLGLWQDTASATTATWTVTATASPAVYSLLLGQ